MSIAVITIADIDKREAGYIHFKDKSQKAWNCNVAELVADLTEGERYKIDYNETEAKGGRKYGSKYINRARLWQEDDGPNTWPDKEPYNPSKYAASSGGTTVAKSDYDPELGAKQTAANCACAYLGRQEGMSVDEFTLMFPVVADSIHKWLVSKGSVPALATDGSGAAAGDEDIPF